MDPKLLTENGWKAVALKLKIKDNGLLKALATYEDTEENKYDERLKRLATVSQLAIALKKSKELTDQPDAAKYLDNVADAAECAKGEVLKAKTLAQKKAEAEAKEKAQA